MLINNDLYERCQDILQDADLDDESRAPIGSRTSSWEDVSQAGTSRTSLLDLL